MKCDEKGLKVRLWRGSRDDMHNAPPGKKGDRGGVLATMPTHNRVVFRLKPYGIVHTNCSIFTIYL